MNTLHFLDLDGTLSASFPYKLPDSLVLKGYEAMVCTRHVDERMITLQRQGIITFAMSSLGEEACAVGTAAALELQDWMYPQYREAGIMFFRGFSMEQYLHHMFCDGKDLVLGRQMPNHYGSRALNVVTLSSPIGSKIPHAAGAAYAMKLQKEPSVTIAYFGEGATSEGDFHAGLNFAAVRKVPCIFFCRNNGYAISTPAEKQFASEGIAPKGIGYGVQTFRVDGNDFFAVYEVTRQAREACLAGKGPILIEAMTFRMGAHSTSDDPSRYRKEEEVERWRGRCPILRLRRYLEKQGLWNEEKERLLAEKIKEEVDTAIQKAKETPNPPMESLVENVYYRVPEKLQKQLEGLK